MHIISDNDLFQRLVFDNPWWKFTPETEIRFRHPPKRPFFYSFRTRVLGGAERIIVLAGPLGAGKTVMVHQMIADLIEGGVSPQAIFYCNMTVPIYTAADIPALFEMFCRRYHHDETAEIYVFYDEIQYVSDWRDVVMRLAELRPRARIVVTMSSAAPALVTGAVSDDGNVATVVLPPLTFHEFLRFRSTEMSSKFSSTTHSEISGYLETLLRSQAGDKSITIHAWALPTLNAEFQRYVNFGGFIEGILGRKEEAAAFTRSAPGGVADRIMHKDLSSIFGINDTQELNKLFNILAFNTARQVTMESLAKAAGIAKNTLRKYLDYLEAAFLIRRVARVDKNALRFQRQVAFKIYLTTPSLYAALFAPLPATDAQFQLLAETALVAQWLGAAEVEKLAYASWQGGCIDLIALDGETDRPTRVYKMDWQDAYGREGVPAELVKFIETTKPTAKPYVLTSATTHQASMGGTMITMIPVALYAYCVGRDLVQGTA